ncbi:murein biosynthesis integral membrane protein MurJ [Aeromicrobium sp.]|uniref:murein biosynthesis integral membrane protein MurJ n=1 Tax=Aeromicrobium sp. TaxID=1871063 RepID=UPI003D6ABB69
MTEGRDEATPDLARSSAWMALGTVTSRITGFFRMLLIAFTIGTLLDADLFNNANTIPNALYILVAGGVFNVVLVPQLVRAMKRDPDGGDAYAHRIITLGLLVLAIATVILLLIVPGLVHLVFDQKLFSPGFENQRESAQLLMWLCMPQVFFYGSFVLMGQVLNARGRFGPMMWAPIANNLVAVAVLCLYLAMFGTSNGTDGFTTDQALLLGLGSTAGVAVQTAVLIPYLRQTGFAFRPRFDFRGVGLGHTLRLGAWTLLFILANQVAFIVIQRLGTRGTLAGAESGEKAAGSAVYEIGFLVSQVPHGVITVSLATAVIPTLAALAADRRHDRMRLELGRTLRLALAIIAPLAVAAACLGPTGANAIAYGGIRGNADVIGLTIAAFAPAMIAFTVHYLMLRGFYANENTRTPFFVQLVIAAVNVAAAYTLTYNAAPARVAALLALSYGLAYVVGATLSTTLLSRSIGPVLDRETAVFAVRLAAACAVAAAVMLGAVAALDRAGLDTDAPGPALGVLVVAGLLGAAAYVGTALLLGLDQLSYVARSLLRRR